MYDLLLRLTIDYLNASTNFLDKDISPKIVELAGHYVDKIVKPLLPKSDEPALCVGMEVAGGVCLFFIY
jgi:hypothetical protein